LISKEFTTDVKVLDEDEGIIEAYVNSMGVVDSDNDIIEPTAFDKSISKNDIIPFLQGHDQSQIIGKVLSLSPKYMDGDQYQLLAKLKVNLETERGRDAFSNIKGGYVNQYSIGFNIPDTGAELKRIGDATVRVINEADLVEVSSVIRGASPDTATISAKTEIPMETEPQDTALDTDFSASDTELAKAKLLLIKTQLELKKYKRKKPKK